MDSHMQKEETVLFPRIKEVDKALEQKNDLPALNAGYITQPIHIIEIEHEEAVSELKSFEEDCTAIYTLRIIFCSHVLRK